MATRSELADFRQFCINATNSQLREIFRKESTARRTAYANVALAVAGDRGVEIEER
jgi:aminoglycoside N3'-acetyltransferase